MLNWKEIVQNYIIKYDARIKKITSPLHDHFGIRYFTYHRIDSEGKYTVLIDRPEWAEYYVENKIFLEDPYLRHPKVYQSGICLMETHGSKEYQKVMMDGAKKILAIDTGVMIIQKTESEVEFFGFCANKETSSLQKLYLNQPELLHSFAQYFKKKTAFLLSKMEKETSKLTDLKGTDFFCSDPISPDVSSFSKFFFLKKVDVDIQKFENLSAREKDCLSLLLEEKSAQETADLLRLSRRTVESYFENIKMKLSCENKRQIYRLAKKFKNVNLLP